MSQLSGPLSIYQVPIRNNLQFLWMWMLILAIPFLTPKVSKIIRATRNRKLLLGKSSYGHFRKILRKPGEVGRIPRKGPACSPPLKRPGDELETVLQNCGVDESARAYLLRQAKGLALDEVECLVVGWLGGGGREFLILPQKDLCFSMFFIQSKMTPKFWWHPIFKNKTNAPNKANAPAPCLRTAEVLPLEQFFASIFVAKENPRSWSLAHGVKEAALFFFFFWCRCFSNVWCFRSFSLLFCSWCFFSPMFCKCFYVSIFSGCTFFIEEQQGLFFVKVGSDTKNVRLDGSWAWFCGLN